MKQVEWRALTAEEILAVEAVCARCGADLQPVAFMGVEFVHDCETGEVAPV